MKAKNRMTEPKIGPTEFAADVERLKAEGKFPSLETLLDAIAETRAEFAPKILAARRVKKERGAR
jgi:hypothetical protein